MANNGEKFILRKVGEILENDSIISGFLSSVNGVKSIFVATTTPVGNAYPMITMQVTYGESHPIVNFTRARIIIKSWLNGPPPENGVNQALSKLKPINDRINLLLNRMGKDSGLCQLSEINVEENVGLRIVRMVKTFKSDLEYDRQVSKYFSMIEFDVGMSEFEDYQTSYGGNFIL